MKDIIQKPGRLFIIIFLFSFLIIFLVWKQVLHQVTVDRKATIAAAVQRNSNLAASLEQYALRTIRNADAVLQLVKMEYEKKGKRIDLKDLLNIGMIGTRNINGIGILDENGRLIISNLNLPQDSLLDFSYREYFYFHKTRRNQLFLSKPLLSKTIGKTVIMLSRRIDKPDESFGGAVAVQIEPSTFMQFYANSKLRERDIISLVAPDGITYARRRGSRESHGEDIHKSPLLKYAAQKAIGNYFAKDAIYGIPTYFSYRKLPAYPVIASVGSAESDILSDHHKRAKREYMFGGIITVLIILFSSFVLFVSAQRRKGTRQIRDSEIRYRSIFENSQDAIIVALGNGQIEAMNLAAVQLFRIEKQRLFSLTLKQLFKDAAPNIKMNESVVGDGSFKGEVLFTRDDNTTFTGEIVYSKYLDVKGELRFIVLVRDISMRKQMEQELLREQERYQQELTKQIILAQEREREIIGHELHDNVNQILTTVKLNLEMAVHNPEARNGFLSKSIQYVMTCISEIRHLSRELSAPTLGTLSLIDSIKGLIDMVASSTSMEISFWHEGYHTSLIKDQKLAIYRILQELMNNIIKHSGASCIKIELSQTEEVTVLIITDNGKGFDPSKRPNGIGLNNILSRAKVFGGDMFIQSKEGHGCSVTVKIPIIPDPAGQTNAIKTP
ncbi:PAS domain S-box protein [Chitinophagaceae bacterium LB-8]|uniref:histidine kinase n=1 Tax=Paraflavisolibacter caeni TaxID=2982496 RepID=A0A9X2XZD0_9BACT|nr:ATP-binding protein [Paraflavisolibacter caeni]MCU7552015.1 PAS domain S-box protein [Paraflavisolibacter caeni]